MTEIECPKCNGGRVHSFTMDCRNCNGTGYDPTEENIYGQCHTCSGEGEECTEICPQCEGDGYIDDDSDDE